MDQPIWLLEKYVSDSGTCPFDKWKATLDEKAQSRVDDRLDRLRFGNFGDHKPIGEELYELRFFFGPGYRIYYAIVEGRIILLIAGGDKKTQSKDIRKAKNIWNRYNAE